MTAIVKDLGDTPDGHVYVWKGKFGNYIKIVKGDEEKRFRLPKEYQKDDGLCVNLKVEDVLDMIQM